MNDPQITAVTDHLFLIMAPNKGRFPHCNSFLFKGEQTLLIDAGLGDALTEKVNALFPIDTLLISHSHPDHILSWSKLRDKTLMLPRETPDSAFDLETLAHRYTGSAEDASHWIDVIGRPLKITALREPDMRYENGVIIDIGTARIEPILAPGHLDDHYCFLDHVSGTLITTDIEFSSFGPWYGNPEGDCRRFAESVKRVMALPYKRVISSHRNPVEGDATDQFNAFLDGFHRQKNDIFNALGTGRTLAELVAVSPLYRNRFMDRGVQNVFEQKMITENLDILLAEGRVVQEGGTFIPKEGQS